MSTRSKHILIAEDEAFLADVMAEVLSKNNVRVSVACNGQQVLETMEKELPDLLLLDLLMPVLDGISVMKAMQKKRLRCPVIVVTNVSNQRTRKLCKKFHVKDYFMKSDMDDNDLWTATQKYLQQTAG